MSPLTLSPPTTSHPEPYVCQFTIWKEDTAIVTFAHPTRLRLLNKRVEHGMAQINPLQILEGRKRIAFQIEGRAIAHPLWDCPHVARARGQDLDRVYQIRIDLAFCPPDICGLCWRMMDHASCLLFLNADSEVIQDARPT